MKMTLLGLVRIFLKNVKEIDDSDSDYQSLGENRGVVFEIHHIRVN